MLTSHILKFCNPYHGGAHGGAPFIDPRSRIQFQKSHFFSYKMLCRSYERPSSAPPCTPKIAPPFAPSFLRPSTRPSLIAPPVAVKMWVFHEIEVYHSTSWAIRRSPPRHVPLHVSWLQSSRWELKLFQISFFMKIHSRWCRILIGYRKSEVPVTVSYIM